MGTPISKVTVVFEVTFCEILIILAYNVSEDREQMLVLNSTDVTLLIWVMAEVQYDTLFVLKST